MDFTVPHFADDRERRQDTPDEKHRYPVATISTEIDLSIRYRAQARILRFRCAMEPSWSSLFLDDVRNVANDLHSHDPAVG